MSSVLTPIHAADRHQLGLEPPRQLRHPQLLCACCCAITLGKFGHFCCALLGFAVCPRATGPPSSAGQPSLAGLVATAQAEQPWHPSTHGNIPCPQCSCTPQTAQVHPAQHHTALAASLGQPPCASKPIQA